MGASREVTFATLVEPGLFIALAALGVAARDASLSAMLGGSVARTDAGPALIMIAVSLFALTLAECSRVPLDDPATHLELTMVHEVMVLDHSGPDLALILYAGALKLGVFAAIILDVLVPGSRPAGAAGLLALPVSLIGLGLGIGLVESAMARLRLPRVPLYLAAGSAMGLFGLILLLR
jgi:formate hydrogenlyase subunit 4